MRIAESPEDLSLVPWISGGNIADELKDDDLALVSVKDLVHVASATARRELALHQVSTSDKDNRHLVNGTLAAVRAAGLAVEIPSRGRPTTRLVVLDDATGSPVIVSSETVPGRDGDLATQLHDVSEAVKSRLQGLAVDRVVVRRADRPPRASNGEGPRLRLLTEGAVTSAARSVVVDTRIGTGKETGSWFGSNKPSVDHASSSLLQMSGINASFVEATSAALAAMSL
jgi:hypothetical protein